MSSRVGQVPFFSPPVVTIHDDANVRWDVHFPSALIILCGLGGQLDLEQIGFFVGQSLINFANTLVCMPLHAVFRSAGFIF